MHIYVSKLTMIGSDNGYGLSHGRHQAIIWTSVGILLIGPLATNFSEIFSFKKLHLKMSFVKWQPFCLGLCKKSLLCMQFQVIIQQTMEKPVAPFTNMV